MSFSIFSTLFYGCLCMCSKTEDNFSSLEKAVALDSNSTDAPSSLHRVCVAPAHLSSSFWGLFVFVPVWRLTGSSEKTRCPSQPTVATGICMWDRDSSLHRSNCRTWFFHEHHLDVTFSILPYTYLLAAQTIVNDRHPPGDKFNDSWNLSLWGTCWLFIVTHKHKADRKFITFRFRWLKWVFDYLEEVVDVYRHLHNKHFSCPLTARQWICETGCNSAVIANIFFVCWPMCVTVTDIVPHIRIQVCWYEAVI